MTALVDDDNPVQFRIIIITPLTANNGNKLRYRYNNNNNNNNNKNNNNNNSKKLLNY
jgi:hypothetical protein